MHTITYQGRTLDVRALIWAADLVVAGSTDGDQLDEAVTAALTGQPLTSSEGEPVALEQIDAAVADDGQTITFAGCTMRASAVDLISELENVYTAGSLDDAAEAMHAVLYGAS
jgi:hypothetical protein